MRTRSWRCSMATPPLPGCHSQNASRAICEMRHAKLLECGRGRVHRGQRLLRLVLAERPPQEELAARRLERPAETGPGVRRLAQAHGGVGTVRRDAVGLEGGCPANRVV